MATLHEGGGRFGLISALSAELGSWAGVGEVVSRAGGIEVRRSEEDGLAVFTCVAGVGKVSAARGAEALLQAGARGALLVVGTCGSLSRSLGVGQLVHCERALQADLGLEGGHEVNPDPGILKAWEAVVRGPRASYLTADRAVMSPWRRLSARKMCSGPCVAEMETAAVGAVSEAWGVPWAALRAVTDRAGWGSHKAFKKRYPVEAGRAADTVRGLLAQMRV